MVNRDEILVVFVVPLVAAAITATLLRRQAWAGGLAAGVAYVLGHALLIGTAAFRPVEAYNWLIYLVPAAAVVGVIGSFNTGPRAAVWVGRILVAAALGYFTLEPLAAGYMAVPTKLAWGGGLAALVVALWWATERLAHAWRGLTSPMVWLIAVGAAAMAVGFSGTDKLMKLGGPLVGALLPLAAVSAGRCEREPARSAAGPVVVLTVGLVANNHFYTPGGVPLWAAGVIALLPLVALLRYAPLLQRPKPWAASLITVGLTALAAAGVLAPLARQLIEDLNDPYGGY